MAMGYESYLYRPINMMLTFFAVSYSTDTFIISVGPQEMLDISFPLQSEEEDEDDNDDNDDVEEYHLPLTEESLQSSISRMQLRSCNPLPAANVSQPMLSSTLSSLTPVPTSGRGAGPDSSSDTIDPASVEGSGSYRIPDFLMVLDHNGTKSLPFIVEVKRFDSEGFTPDNVTMGLYGISTDVGYRRQILYQMKAAFDTYQDQDEISTLYIAGNYWCMFHATRDYLGRFPFPHPDDDEDPQWVATPFTNKGPGFLKTSWRSLWNIGDADYHPELKRKLTVTLQRFGLPKS
ncbi:hypothetical protein BJ138DRAFT_1118522 [Hygrophoropsis aurantiaca]|uniref:Uncharacterized protein n=1 Tax=Hygrophoropsis aurantiaca TaxID=72124 RepID=A0ACB7ZWF7_9AGAM|nr:hypothetical protein BJ138DRAFT_1118522 [Hygrophoropsis aurantiaca]